jgi:hypothetical protein
MENFKVGDVIRSQHGRYYELVSPTLAVCDGTYCCPRKYWPTCRLIGNVKDNPELSCARMQTHD